MPFILSKTVTYVSSLPVTYLTSLYTVIARQMPPNCCCENRIATGCPGGQPLRAFNRYIRRGWCLRSEYRIDGCRGQPHRNLRRLDAPRSQPHICRRICAAENRRQRAVRGPAPTHPNQYIRRGRRLDAPRSQPHVCRRICAPKIGDNGLSGGQPLRTPIGTSVGGGACAVNTE